MLGQEGPPLVSFVNVVSYMQISGIEVFLHSLNKTYCLGLFFFKLKCSCFIIMC